MSRANRQMLVTILDCNKLSDRKNLLSEYLAKKVLPILIGKYKTEDLVIQKFNDFSLLFPESVLGFSYKEQTVKFIGYAIRRIKRENKKVIKDEKSTVQDRAKQDSV